MIVLRYMFFLILIALGLYALYKAAVYLFNIKFESKLKIIDAKLNKDKRLNQQEAQLYARHYGRRTLKDKYGEKLPTILEEELKREEKEQRRLTAIRNKFKQ